MTATRETQIAEFRSGVLDSLLLRGCKREMAVALSTGCRVEHEIDPANFADGEMRLYGEFYSARLAEGATLLHMLSGIDVDSPEMTEALLKDATMHLDAKVEPEVLEAMREHSRLLPADAAGTDYEALGIQRRAEYEAAQEGIPAGETIH